MMTRMLTTGAVAVVAVVVRRRILADAFGIASIDNVVKKAALVRVELDDDDGERSWMMIDALNRWVPRRYRSSSSSSRRR